MGYKEAVQILQQADVLKAKVQRKCDLLNDASVWTDQQKLQTIYHQALVLDLEYALDKKVEQDLWNIGFKSYISNLQELARNKKDPKRGDYQTLLNWCLETASGFYLTLLHELCNTFDIDLPFRRRGSYYGQLNLPEGHSTTPQASSCQYICQYCLVHLGDIARYRNQRKQAENFYKQAIIVSPINGHPYNQLALLEASRGDKLSTIYYYVRALAVKNPFSAATSNLLSTLNSAMDRQLKEPKLASKINLAEFYQLFLAIHGHLYTATEPNLAAEYVKTITAAMTALVATETFTKEDLIKITTINLFSYYHVVSSDASRGDDLTEDEEKVRQLSIEMIAGSLSAFLVPVHTLKLDESVLDYYALPAIKLIMDFVRNRADLLKEAGFSSKLQIWPSLCKLLNHSQKYLKSLNCNKYVNTALPEDKMLQGFIVFEKNYKHFQFSDEIADKIYNLLRLKRLSDFSVWLSNFEVAKGSKLIIKNETNNELGFEPGYIQPDPTDDLLEQMKSFNMAKATAFDFDTDLKSRRAGILKPQGSLEKAREEKSTTTTFNVPSVDGTRQKRSQKQNVALQSIYRKIEETSGKQVKFVEIDERTKNHTANTNVNFGQMAQNNYYQGNQGNPFLENAANYFPPPQGNFPQNTNQSTFGSANPNNFQGNSNSFMPNQNLSAKAVNSNNPLYNNQNPYFNNYYPPGQAPNQFVNRNAHENSNSNAWWPNYAQQPPPNRQMAMHQQQMPINQQQRNYPYNNFFGQQQYALQPPDGVNNEPAVPPFDQMTMRQAMLKEVSPKWGGNNENANSTSQVGSYSLFNANNSWTPNLGQLRGSGNGSSSKIGRAHV